MRILITGATGFIGRALCEHLAERDDVVAVSRDVAAAQRRLGTNAKVLPLPVTAAEWAAALEGCDGVVNLAGESIAAGRWTDERKRRIRDSRVELTRELVQGLHATAAPPRVLVSASAVGYYGPHGDEQIDESAAAGGDFLAEVCLAWEREALAAEAGSERRVHGERPLVPTQDERAGVRVVRLRIGVVLGEGGGALERMVTPFRFFAGGPLGSGRQWISWIHRDDVVGLIDLALHDPRVEGALNATAPEPQKMRDFCRILGKVLARPSWAPVPEFVLRLALGDMADMLLTGQRVVPAAAQKVGYHFRYPELEAALRAILSR
jgi:uncharacterized protein